LHVVAEIEKIVVFDLRNMALNPQKPILNTIQCGEGPKSFDAANSPLFVKWAIRR
jgi:hypothetical protein